MLNYNLYFIVDAIRIWCVINIFIVVCECLRAAQSFRLFCCEFYCTLDMGHERMSSSSKSSVYGAKTNPNKLFTLLVWLPTYGSIRDATNHHHLYITFLQLNNVVTAIWVKRSQQSEEQGAFIRLKSSK